MKKLTQAIFDDAPEWVKSAATDYDGEAWFYDVNVCDLDIDDWAAMWSGDKVKEGSRIGDGFDAMDWQNSAIDREVAK